ncbi:MAG: NADH:flavin oxidoreductase [Desulfovibrionaceae bacterium]|nr:NADH:flavin oxidoreductase [Desulfovibrionaceae bacterium]MBF0513904.1 NADH:flavin oxidoreductase [Desulfovibrionaceae bacterium]
MNQLFTSIRIGSMTLKNRFLRSATFEGLAGPGGEVTEKLAALMAELARGRAGLIVTGNAYVRGDGRTRPTQMAIDRDELLPGLARMAEAAHREGGAIAVQIAHSGCYSDPVDGSTPLGLSNLSFGKIPACRELTGQDASELASAFARAAVRARAAGFDAVQLHAAHGYLLSQALSPYYNRRTDAYGGPIENRMKLPLEVYRAVRSAVGGDYPVLIKINSRDYLEPGLTPEETALVCRTLQDEGLDLAELSGGTMASDPKFSPIRAGRCDTPGREAWFRVDAAAIKASLAIPVALVGGVRAPQTAKALIEEGAADLIALSRPLIREPGLIARWESGDLRPAACLSDNLCMAEARSGRGLRCMREGEKTS